MKKEPLIVLAGPTAVGKTALSISLAKAVGGEIISADSIQVYRHMDIGSAKITPDEMDSVPHYLLDVLEPMEDFHVVRFQQMAKEAMREIRSHGHIPILVGGTGFYIQAVTRDIDFTENEATPYRQEMEALAREKGSAYLHGILADVDPASAKNIHENNTKRVIRALEFYHLTGRRISEHNEEQRERSTPYNLACFVLTDERERLYARIDQRVDAMLAAGLVNEVTRLKAMGCRQEMTSMKGLGYKEILAYLDGECTLDEAVEILKRDTRHFAKRQLTWFRREQDAIWLNKKDFAYDEKKMLTHMLEILQEREITEQKGENA
ncbi:MAG: tRNA (adenosine(37)-N6)-dimethylallyltransferase MiaA [Lachnospiraceae bacterium]|nr:tRNA (adenosine(37)-N6)-dimethylallyltransferase MiaA [Lachnospiraceae bacterium]